MSTNYQCDDCGDLMYPDEPHTCPHETELGWTMPGELEPQPRPAKEKRLVIPVVPEDAKLPTLSDEYGAYEGFITKDSGQRQEFSTGMKRDVQTNKPRYDLLDRVMLKRWAELMARGAEKYGEENWRLASTEEELRRFKASAIRHLFQWLNGETDEDHACAVFFNISGAEYVAGRLRDDN